MDTSMTITAEAREYIQSHRLWYIGELLTYKVMTERPDHVDRFFSLVLEQELQSPATEIPIPDPTVAYAGKQYLLDKRIAYIVEEWYRHILKMRPHDPLRFSYEYFRSRANSALIGPTSEPARRAKILILVYSVHGHLYPLARSAADGVLAAGHFVEVKRIPETLPADSLRRVGAVHSNLPIAIVGDLAFYDGFIFAFPTRFGTAPAQMCAFADQTGPLWLSGVLTRKPAGIMTASATQHGGQESTLRNFSHFLLHHGCVLVGLPPSCLLDDGRERSSAEKMDVEGGSFYGVSTIVGGRGEREPSPVELRHAFSLGGRVASIATKLNASL